MHYFGLFFKIFNKPCVTFSRVWTKTSNCWEILRKVCNFWWKFNRKIEFLSIFGKVVAKNRSFGNNIIFLQQFFPGSGGAGLNPQPPCLRHWLRVDCNPLINDEAESSSNYWTNDWIFPSAAFAPSVVSRNQCFFWIDRAFSKDRY